jgi:hypothetical protein
VAVTNQNVIKLDLCVTDCDEKTTEDEESAQNFDDLTWGEELAEGIGVCEKLVAANAELDLTPDGFSKWVWAIFRQHLQQCNNCKTSCSAIVRNLAALDDADEKELASLFPACALALHLGEQRARELLAKEWKAAGCECLPSERGTAGLTGIKWYKPLRSEFQQCSDWLEMLEWRAAVLCWHTGKKMRECEASHEVPSSGDGIGLWLKWRKSAKDDGGRDFVSGLDQRVFRVAILSRHMASVLPFSRNNMLRIPTDGDLASSPGTLDAVTAVRIEDWKSILGLPVEGLDYGALLRIADMATTAATEAPYRTDLAVISENNVESPGQCYREVNGLLDFIEGVRNRDEAQQIRISRLMSEGRIPKPVSSAMHTIRTYRNLGEHEDHELNRRQKVIFILSWNEITSWGESQGWVRPRRSN